MTIPLCAALPRRFSCQPGHSWAETSLAEVSGSLAADARTFPREAPIRHCSGWGLPCRPGYPVRGGLLLHRFTLTPSTASCNRGGLFSVALSLGLPPPGITRHPVFMESGLSSHTLRRTRSSSHPRPVAIGPQRAEVNSRCCCPPSFIDSPPALRDRRSKPVSLMPRRP